LGHHGFRVPFANVETGAGEALDDRAIGAIKVVRREQAKRVRRPGPPSRRARRLDMHRTTFLILIGCWGSALLVLLALGLALRFLG
jgi:hypothetical protein